jgi:phosphate transport system substrate-binding protein
MLLKKMLTAPIAAVLFMAATLTEPASAANVELRGAGATFVAPLVNGWIKQFESAQPDVAIRYDSVGSGEGIARFLARSVDFAASDNRLSPANANKIEGGAVQVPSTAGMIVLAYNLPGVDGKLQLPQSVYADIFLGKIRTWNDPRIREANKGLDLPALTIAIVTRQDSSGTTYAFTEHLAAVSKAWSEGPGVGKVIQWPNVAMLARGNEGVASKIKIAEGSIGYVEYGFALRLGLQMAVLENKDGKFVAPTPQSGAAALTPNAGAGLEALGTATINPPGPDAYPIVTYSWFFLYPSYPAEKARVLVSFLTFAYEEGQNSARYLGYIPLPVPVVEQARAALARFGKSAEASEKASVVVRTVVESPKPEEQKAPAGR